MAKAKYKKDTDGYYSTNVWDGTYKDNGKKHYKHLRSRQSSRDLEKKVKEFEQLRDQRKAVMNTDMSFMAYCEQWKNLYKSNRANNTLKMYDNVINVHFKPLTDVKLQDIQRSHLQLILNNADGKLRTQQQIVMTFRQVMESAVCDHIYPAQGYQDIFNKLEKIKYKAKEKRPLTYSERNAVFKASYKYQMDMVYTYLIYGCGLRCGEALALTESDIDLRFHTVSILKSHDISDNIPKRKSVKNIENGERVLPIPANVFDVIADYVKLLREEKREYLFVNQNYKPMSKSGYRRMWGRILKALQEVSEAPIVDLTSHIFRHNYCTNLCYQVPLISFKRVAELVGDSEKVVAEVYSHIMLEKEDSVAAVNNALSLEQKVEQSMEQKMEQGSEMVS